MPEWWSNLGELNGWTGPTLYLIVFALVFIESGIPIGFLLPGDTVLFAAGLLSAQPSSGITTVGMVSTVVAAAILGDLVGYETGRRYGRPWLLRRFKGEPGPQLERADEFVRRFGSVSIVACRFIPWLRTFVPILAGIGRMRFAGFMLANVAGALIWGAGLVLLGRVAHENETVRYIAYAIAAVAVASGTVLALLAALRRRREAAG